MLANRYMNRYLRYWRQCEGEKSMLMVSFAKANKHLAKLVNYADAKKSIEWVILSKGKAQQALTWTRTAMTRLKLEINETKTSIKNARTEQFDFLGLSFGLHYVKRRCGKRYLGASASDKSVQRLKDKVGDLLKTQPGPWPEIRDKLNRTLSGWKNYFHYGSVRNSYQAIDHHVRTKVRNFLQRRHKDPSRGTHQFSHTVIFKEYGVFEMAKR